MPKLKPLSDYKRRQHIQEITGLKWDTWKKWANRHGYHQLDPEAVRARLTNIKYEIPKYDPEKLEDLEIEL